MRLIAPRKAAAARAMGGIHFDGLGTTGQSGFASPAGLQKVFNSMQAGIGNRKTFHQF